MQSEYNTLPTTSNNKITNFGNNSTVIKIKSFFWKLFDNNKILWYEYSDNWVSRFMDKSVYNGMTFDEKSSLGQVKPVSK